MPPETLQQLIGKSIKSASSSLNSFTIEFNDGEGLAVSPTGTVLDPSVDVTLVSANQLPKSSEAVCSVDWSWIYGSTIEKATNTDGRIQLKLNPAGPLNVWSAFWQGKPFLAFQPHSKP